MLNRLAELKRKAEDTTVRPDSDVVSNIIANESTPQLDSQLEVEEAELRGLLDEDAAARDACARASRSIETLQQFSQQVQNEIMPRRLEKMVAQFDGAEEACQTLIRRFKELLGNFEQETPSACTIDRIRAQLYSSLAKEFTSLLDQYIAIRESHTHERLIRLNRQLHYAYPDATIQELERLLESPKLAEYAMSIRKDKPGIPLAVVSMELQSKYSNLLRLEENSRELKAVFFEFSELVDTQGKLIDQIETNVQEVAENTTNAIQLLDSAHRAQLKRERELWSMRWRRAWFLTKVLIVITVIYLVVHPVEGLKVLHTSITTAMWGAAKAALNTAWAAGKAAEAAHWATTAKKQTSSQNFTTAPPSLIHLYNGGVGGTNEEHDEAKQSQRGEQHSQQYDALDSTQRNSLAEIAQRQKMDNNASSVVDEVESISSLMQFQQNQTAHQTTIFKRAKHSSKKVSMPVEHGVTNSLFQAASLVVTGNVKRQHARVSIALTPDET